MIPIATTLSSCKKEKFTGRQSFWYNESVADALYFEGVDNLTLYVDGEIVGTVNADEFYSSKPDCKDGHFVYEEKMYKKEISSHTYKIIDDFGDIIWQGDFKNKESVCNSIELTN